MPRIKPRMKTSCQVFADKGDPWITDKEREREYPTKPSENPDLDCWTKATRVKKKESIFKPKPVHENDRKKCSHQQRKALIVYQMHMALLKKGR